MANLRITAKDLTALVANDAKKAGEVLDDMLGRIKQMGTNEITDAAALVRSYAKMHDLVNNQVFVGLMGTIQSRMVTIMTDGHGDTKPSPELRFKFIPALGVPLDKAITIIT